MDRGGGGRPRIPAHISDEALDDYVTELILEEARMKDPAYQRDYQRPPRPREPPTRTNKRFLASMISNVDSHNQRIAAEEARNERRRLRKPSRWDVVPGGRSRLPRRRDFSEDERIRSKSPQRRSASPETGPQPAPKVRQWDLGKNLYL